MPTISRMILWYMVQIKKHTINAFIKLWSVSEPVAWFDSQRGKMSVQYGSAGVCGYVVVREGNRPNGRKSKGDLNNKRIANNSNRFIPHFAIISEPLRRLTRTEVPFCFGPEQRSSFEALKRAWRKRVRWHISIRKLHSC